MSHNAGPRIAISVKIVCVWKVKNLTQDEYYDKTFLVTLVSPVKTFEKRGHKLGPHRQRGRCSEI